MSDLSEGRGPVDEYEASNERSEISERVRVHDQAHYRTKHKK